MNALTVVFAALCIFAIGYRFYGLFIANKVLNLNDARVTPAVKYSDGHDYVDTNKYVLFGHHFAAIAAAGPLLGPVLAAQFGYMPGLLWYCFGLQAVWLVGPGRDHRSDKDNRSYGPAGIHLIPSFGFHSSYVFPPLKYFCYIK